MKLTIGIPEGLYDNILQDNCSMREMQILLRVIKNGAPIDECKVGDCISRADVNRIICEYRDDAVMGDLKDVERAYGANAVGELISELPSVYPKSDKSSVEWIEQIKQIIGDWNDSIEGKKNGYGANVYMRKIKEVFDNHINRKDKE